MSWRTESSHMKTLTYTVHASREQAERWEAAAAVQGRMAIGAWLAATADAYLRELAKAGRPRPLAWYRGRFVTTLLDKDRQPYETDVPGIVSSHFGIFRGDNRGLGGQGCFRHSLVHLPTRRILGTLPLSAGLQGVGGRADHPPHRLGRIGP